jgi:hypothetical protein
VITDRDLLRAAWPDGYLPMRGVRTVEGWTCVRGGDGSLWLAPEEHEARRLGPWPIYGFVGGKPCHDLGDAHAAGDLLPAVDPADPATWACLLHDLADATWPTRNAKCRSDVWLRQGTRGGWVVCAAFLTEEMYVFTLQEPVEIEPTDDPAFALVRIRACLRERDAEQAP